MKNTRKHPRLKTGYIMKYMMIDGGMPEMVKTANTKDISASGVRFWTNESIPEGTLLRVQILIPPLLHDVSAFGRVVRSREASRDGIFYVSLAFLEISKKDYEDLEEFIQSRLKTREAQLLFDEADIVLRKPEEEHRG